MKALILTLIIIGAYVLFYNDTTQSLLDDLSVATDNHLPTSQASVITPAEQLVASIQVQDIVTNLQNIPTEVQDKIDIRVPPIIENNNFVNLGNNNVEFTEQRVFNLEAWNIAKKGRLAEVISTLVSEDVAEYFKFSHRSAFASGFYPTHCSWLDPTICKEPMTIQKPDKEEVWVAVMESNFRYLVSQYESDYWITLLDVSCKLLVCELFISLDKEDDRNVSRGVGFHFHHYLTNAPELEFMRKNDARTQLSSYQYGVVDYKYYSFSFYEDFSAD